MRRPSLRVARIDGGVGVASGWRVGNGRSYGVKKGRKDELDESKLTSVGRSVWVVVAKECGRVGSKKGDAQRRGVREYR